AGRFTNTGAVHINELFIRKLLAGAVQRVGIQSSGSRDTGCLGIKVAVAAHVVDASTSRPLPGRLGRDCERNGTKRVRSDPQPDLKGHVTGNEDYHNPAHDLAERLVASGDRCERAAEEEADSKVCAGIERGTGHI